MRNLFALLLVLCVVNSCSVSDPLSDDSSQETGIYDAPSVSSYTTYISQNSATLNGFINYENIAFLEKEIKMILATIK